MKGIKLFLIILLIPIVITLFWNQVPFIKDSVHAALDPTVGELLNYNVTYGMLIITAIVMLITTIIQKYTTDNDTLREIKKEQKILQEEMKKYKEHPEKLLELQKKQLEFIPKTFEITMRPAMFTIIPFILLIRWFQDYFVIFEPPLRILGFLSWFWAYLIFSIVFSLIFRKLLRLP